VAKALLHLVTFAFVAVVSSGLAWSADAFTQAVMLYGDKKYDQSEKLLLQHLAVNPRSADAHYYLASCYHYEGKLAEAKKEYQLILSAFPGTQAATYAAQGLGTISLAAPTAAAGSAAQTQRSGANPFEANPPSTKDDVIPDQEWIPYTKYTYGNIRVRASINGRPLEMTFDTGASTTVIGLKHWLAMGFPRPSGKPDGRSYGVGGGIDMWSQEVEVSLGKIKKHMLVNIAEKLASEPLLGETFFGDFQYNIDNSAGYIHFFRKGHTSSASAIPYNSIDIPFRNEGNNMVISGKINGHNQEFFFDTGASSCHFSMYNLINLGIRIPPDAMVGASMGVGGLSRTFLFPVDSIEVGDLKKTNFRITVSSDMLPYPLLGQTFFGDRRYVIDNDRKLIRFNR
jgi:predicted aspartyl protease